MRAVNIKARLKAYVKVSPKEALSQGLSPLSIQQSGSIAGTRGYYFKHIDLTNKKIYLTTE